MVSTLVLVLALALPISAEATWTLDPRGGSFSTASACNTEAAAWIARAREGARWVTAQQQEALQQQNRAIITFGDRPSDVPLVR